MTLSPEDVWRNVSKNIGFHTKETRALVPEAPGIYAWFVPLWLYEPEADDLELYIKKIQEIFLYDAGREGPAISSALVDFNWELLEVNVERTAKREPGTWPRKRWQKMTSEPDIKEGFAESLMAASIFMPPVYVGKADNLRERYRQHTEGTGKNENSFHKRFTTFSREVELGLQVDDLLFVCVQTPGANKALRTDTFNRLLETTIMLLASPAFSVR